ncbi:hypothetical protein [Propionispora sp. 2/2-37]|uniref:hypothetical protein n=1 Tax=Propionispora sp. 2/2-37 TaxID=1677858 RepID=UPI0006BB6CB9|nr:hypothetical protein [Propionispora sp. 2/2-37]
MNIKVAFILIISIFIYFNCSTATARVVINNNQGIVSKITYVDPLLRVVFAGNKNESGSYTYSLQCFAVMQQPGINFKDQAEFIIDDKAENFSIMKKEVKEIQNNKFLISAIFDAGDTSQPTIDSILHAENIEIKFILENDEVLDWHVPAYVLAEWKQVIQETQSRQSFNSK